MHVGIDFKLKTMTVSGKRVRMQIWYVISHLVLILCANVVCVCQHSDSVLSPLTVHVLYIDYL